MRKRNGLSASLRWSIFARDGFTCMYCGRAAGQGGIELHVDHIKSVADGGTDEMTNLVSSCSECNGGKGARSLIASEFNKDIIDRVNDRRRRLEELSNAVDAVLEHRKYLEQQVVNIKCHAYDVKEVDLGDRELKLGAMLLEEWGPEKVIEWYEAAARRGVREATAIQYVCGCARRTNEQLAVGDGE